MRGKVRMRKLLTGILIATFISAFIIVYLSNYETSLNAITLNWKDMGRILEKWIAILGIVAIPVVLYFLGQQEQQRKEKEKANKLKEKIEECKLHLVHYINQTGQTMSTTHKDNSKPNLFPEILSMIAGSFITTLGMNVSDLKFCKLLQNILCKLKILMYDNDSQLRANPSLAVFGKSDKGKNSYQQTGFYLMDLAQKIENGDHDKLILRAIEEEN